MDFRTLQLALDIQGGTVTIGKDTIPDLDGILKECYDGQPIVLSETVPGIGDGLNETVVRYGRSPFLNQRALPVVATFKLVSGAVQATLRYTLPSDWKFSHSFPDLPPIFDWRSTPRDRTKHTSIPLDELEFADAFIVVASHQQQGHEPEHMSDAELETFKKPGISFLGTLLATPDPTGVAGAIGGAFGCRNNTFPVSGTIRIPHDRDTTATLKPHEQPWDNDNQPPPPGILLRAKFDSDFNVPLGEPPSGLKFGEVCFRIYSPTSKDWWATNPGYAPVAAYTGTLSLPNTRFIHDDGTLADPPNLRVTAFQELGGDELLLTGRFTGAYIGNFASLVDIAGGNDLHGWMDGTLKTAVDELKKLQLTYASLAIGMKADGSVEVTTASVQLGMPKLNWTVFKDVFEIERAAALIEVRHPFDTNRKEDPLDWFRFGKDRVGATVTGGLKVFSRRFDFTATARKPYTVNAQLAAGETIPLSDLTGKYKDCVPLLSPNAEIDYLAFTAEYSGEDSNWCTFAGRVKGEPKLAIAQGLTLSEVVVYLKVTGSRFEGELSAVLNIGGGLDLNLKTAKSGSDWLFAGSIAEGQTVGIDSAVDRVAGTGTFTTITPDGLPGKLGSLSGVSLSVNLTKSVYLLEGSLKDFGWAYLLYQGAAATRTDAGGETGPPAKSAYVFAAGLGRDFKFAKILDALAPIDALLTVKDATLAVYSVEHQGRAGGLNDIKGLVDQLVRAEAGRWPLPETVADDLSADSGVLLTATIEQSTTDFRQSVRIGTSGGEAAANIRLLAIVNRNKVEESVFGVALSDITFLGTIRLTSITVTFRAKNDGEFVLKGRLVVQQIFGKDYTFQGSLTRTPALTTGELSASSRAGTKDPFVANPFDLPGIDITGLWIRFEKQATQETPKFTLVGSALLGPRPATRPQGPQPEDDRASFKAMLGLSDGQPVLMSITLNKDLAIGKFLAYCFTGKAQEWPGGFIELTLKAHSRIYYYNDEVTGSGNWEKEPEPDGQTAYRYEPGFNVDARAELALGDSVIPLRFTLRSKLRNKEPVSFKAACGLKTPVKLWFIELAGDSADGGTRAYTGGPALYIETPDSNQASWKFGLSLGMNFFGGKLAKAYLDISRVGSNGTQVAGTIKSDTTLDVFGDLSFSLVYTREGNGNQSLVIRDWPAYGIAKQLFDIVAKINELAENATGECGRFVEYGFAQLLVTTYTVSPSVEMSGNKPQFVVTLTCSMHAGSASGPVVLEWDKVKVPVDVPENTAFASLAGTLEGAIVNAATEIVSKLLQQPEKVALYLAIAFGEKCISYALDLLCRSIKLPGGGSRSIVPPSVPTLVPIAWTGLLELGGFAALVAGGVGTLAALAGTLVSKLRDLPSSDQTNPDKLATPEVLGLAFDGAAFTGEWTAVAFAAEYQFDAIGPAPFKNEINKKIRGLKYSVPIAGDSLAPGEYSWRLRAVSGNRTSEWSETRVKFVAPVVRLTYVDAAGTDNLQAAWTPLPGGAWTYDLELLFNGASEEERKKSTAAALQSWPLADPAPGKYTARLKVKAADRKYLESDWSAESNGVVRLAPPAREMLTYNEADDTVHAIWAWQGGVKGIAFHARLVEHGSLPGDGVTPTAALPTPSATGARFDSTNLPVRTFRVEAQALAQPASPVIAPSIWSPSVRTIAKLPPPKIVSVVQRAGIKSSIDVSMESAVAGADVYYAQLFYAGVSHSRVGFQAGEVATLPLPDDYNGPAHVEVRAAKRDGSAIASNWDKRDVVRLAPPRDVTFIYVRSGSEGRAIFRFSPAIPDARITARLAYEIRLLAGTPLAPFGEPLPPMGDAAPYQTEIQLAHLPAGPVQALVRTVAPDDPRLLPSAWSMARAPLTKLGNVAVNEVTYLPKTDRVRIELATAAELGVIYNVKFEGSHGWEQPNPEFEVPNPFDLTNDGSRTVSARLLSRDSAVIDGEWQEAEPTLKLTKFPSPASASLDWSDAKGKLAVGFSPAPGVVRHEVQLVANNNPIGEPVPTDPNTAEIDLDLDEKLPSGSIMLQVRSTGPAPRTVSGNWRRSATRERPDAYNIQPELLYKVDEDSIFAQWTATPTAPIRLAAQLVSGPTNPKPLGVEQIVNFPSLPARIRAGLKFGDDLPPGEVRVRFRKMPLSPSALPGVWATSTQTLTRLSSAYPEAEYRYVDGTLTITVSTLDYDPRPTTFDLSFVKLDGPSDTFPSMRVPVILRGHVEGDFTVKPEDFPYGLHTLRIRTIGEDNQTINGAERVLNNIGLTLFGRPKITGIGYASGRLSLSWDKIAFVIRPMAPVLPYNVRIDAGGGNKKMFGVAPTTDASPVTVVLDKLDGLPKGVVWNVALQAVGSYGGLTPGSGPWSEPASVLSIEAPTGAGTNRQVGPSRPQITDGSTPVMPESLFDDLDAVEKLNLPLSEIIVYHSSGGYIGGIQACYGYGEQRTVLPLHGASSSSLETIKLQPDSPITRISGCASLLRGKEIRLAGLRFFTGGAANPFRQIGNASWGSRDFLFSFDSQPEEVVLAFFGTTYASAYAEQLDAGVEFLGSLGVWMRRTV